METTVSTSQTESSDVPPSVERVREIQDAIDKVPAYLQEFKQSYLNKAEAGEFGKLGSSQSMLSKHPTYPVLVRDETLLQKDFLKKLKSKYIEMAAKAQFLKFLRQDENQWGQAENDKIEAENAIEKAELREYKVNLAQSFDKASILAKELETERPELLKEAKEANRLAKEVMEMRLELMRLGRDRPVEDRLTITTAEKMIHSQLDQIASLDAELAEIQGKTLASKAASKQVEKDLEAIRPALIQARATLQADAMAGKAEGRGQVEKLSRMRDWYQSAEDFYKDTFGLVDIATPSENELRLSYDHPRTYTVSLIFNPTTNQLADAKVTGLDEVDISEATELAVEANDGRRLLSFIQLRVALLSRPS